MVQAKMIPAPVDILISNRTAMNFLIDYDIDLTGQTTEAFLVYNDGDTVELTVVDTDLPNGQLNLTLSLAKVILIPVNVTHNWYLDRTNAGSERRHFAGEFEVTNYKDV